MVQGSHVVQSRGHMMKRLIASWLIAAACPLAVASESPSRTPVAAPSILVEPLDQRILPGDFAVFEVVAAGGTPRAYQWRRNGTNLTGAVYSRLVRSEEDALEEGRYSVVITNSTGAVTSRVAQLSVRWQSGASTLGLNPFQAGSGTLSFPVTFYAVGDEASVAGSVQFNPAVLKNPTLTRATNLAQLTLALDTNQANAGLVGWKLSQPAGTNFAAGWWNLGTLGFQLETNRQPAEAALAWTSIPTPLQALDATNGVLAVDTFVMPQVFPAALPVVWNPQSGLYTHKLEVVYPGANAIPGIQVFVDGLTNDAAGHAVVLMNAGGVSSCLQAGPLAAGSRTILTAEFYVADRKTLPTPVYSWAVVQPADSWAVGTIQPTDRVLATNGVFLVDFPTALGSTYYVQYKTDITDPQEVWRTVLPAIAGTGTCVQWMDNGPPKTAVPMVGLPTRYYRVIKL